ncbi:AAA family ATPase [Thermoleptolyngbya sichuanensis A183]|uniref:AAA family ATPase n=1 Tax=Thermoleptolyngbya sichuanensis A183 TaxID=2737172 RepID=A0A6M8BKM0_9CYAN|nr:AAA family ATPase [Thermoleptolyngbya sichuanensis]QKD82885.1 AAA family ATPase [Thermoleptolyngbya sichuanensis A183]
MSYYIPPKFLDRLSVHITKNFLALPNVKVPLILGIHGRKGEGKTFMCELVFKRMGLGAVYMSAGELESPDAGDPARLIRLRYREAGEWSRTHGRMAVLMINDVDAGIGRVDASTQYTVNTQLVNATLMNIADNPTNVQLPGSYDAEPTQRIPIIVTGNDFATLYAPLIRDGRMEKFFWDPTRDDRLGIVAGIFEADGVPRSDVEALVDHFAEQATDFFGALRSRLYDEQVRTLIHQVGIDKISQEVVHSDGKPTEFQKPNFSLQHLIEIGTEMVQEQERIRELRLVSEYNEVLKGDRPRSANRASHSISKSDKSFMYYGDRPGSAEPPPAKSANGNGMASLKTSPTGTRPAIAAEVAEEIRSILAGGLRLGIEYVDERRYRMGSWQCFGTYDGNPEEAIAALERCIAEHPKDYIRLITIDKHRNRMGDRLLQRP